MNTSDIKQLITKLLTGELKEEMESWALCGWNYEQSSAKEQAKYKKDFFDGTKWKRMGKCLVGSNVSPWTFEGATDDMYDLTDMLGDSSFIDKSLIPDNINAIKKCVYRIFLAPEPFEDAWRFEIVTTPDDSQVIRWSFTVD